MGILVFELRLCPHSVWLFWSEQSSIIDLKAASVHLRLQTELLDYNGFCPQCLSKLNVKWMLHAASISAQAQVKYRTEGPNGPLSKSVDRASNMTNERIQRPK